jgi:hypothetical protein
MRRETLIVCAWLALGTLAMAGSAALYLIYCWP